MDALRHGNFRLATLLSVIVLGLGLAGCGGDDGNDGAPGAAGTDGLNCWDLNENGIKDLPDEDLNNDGVVNTDDCNALANIEDGEAKIALEIAASKPESCETCHAAAGSEHQEIYDRYVDESALELNFDAGDISSVDNGDGTFTVTVQFEVLLDGQPFDDPDIATGDRLIDQRTFYTVEYFDATREYLNSCSLNQLTFLGNGLYTASRDSCLFAPEVSNAHVYGYVAMVPLFVHEGGAGAETPAGTHVHLYDHQANTAVGFGTAASADPASYESAANVAGCVKCHGSPYLKHGYRAAEVEGIPDFAACKSCHYDDRSGGHEDWQWMVDDPYAWATTELGAAEEALYAYTANVMNDTHMSHAMEFPFPSSMANCATCHEGKLDQVLADEEFVAETCKSCHAVQGVDAWPDDVDVAGSQYYQEGRAPAMEYIWTEAGVEGFHSMDLDCQLCHVAGTGIPTFADLHSGYWDRVYMDDGTKYAGVYTASIDDVSVDLAANTMTVTFSVSDPAIEPELLVSFYDLNTKNFIVPSHQGDENRAPAACGRGCRFEWEPGDVDNPIFPSVTGTGTAADPYVATVDLTGWTGIAGMEYQTVPDLIADGTVTKAQITVLPGLQLDGTPIALSAVTEAFDLGENGVIANYYNGTAAIVSTDGCNVCHEQLGATFHAGSGRGGDVAMCRNCHNPTFPGSHLEMASRSIVNYAHTIHSFQDFDTDDIFNGGVSDQVPGWDPVYTARYDLHIKHVFPNFTITNCEACHNPETFNPPDQSQTIPGVLSGSYDVDSWYGIYDNTGAVPGKPFETASRNISGNIPEYVTGPASRACGGCHRARLINQDAAGALASWNAHTLTNGTYAENDSDDVTLFGIIDKIMAMFK